MKTEKELHKVNDFLLNVAIPIMNKPDLSPEDYVKVCFTRGLQAMLEYVLDRDTITAQAVDATITSLMQTWKENQRLDPRRN